MTNDCARVDTEASRATVVSIAKNMFGPLISLCSRCFNHRPTSACNCGGKPRALNAEFREGLVDVT